MVGTKRDAIVAAAAELFRSEGVHAASMAKIREASGASAGSIYHHFDSKDEIVLAVAGAAMVAPLQALLENNAGALLSPGEILRLIVGAVAEGEMQAALLVQLWAASSADEQLRTLLQKQVTDLRHSLRELVEAWLDAQGLAVGRAESIARLTVGQAMGVLTQRTLDPGFDHDVYVTEAAQLLDGLGRS